jgi:phenylacetate-CoA ligase
MMRKIINQENSLAVFDALSGSSILERYRKLMRNMRKKPEEIRKMQDKKVRQLISHAYETVPYYRKVMEKRRLTPDDIKGVSDLQKLPILTKDEILADGAALISRKYKNKKLYKYQTGGSSGKSICLMLPKERFHHYKALNLRTTSYLGMGLNDRYCLIWGGPNEIRSAETAMGKLKNLVMNRIFLDTFRWNDAKMLRFAKKINEFKPVGITGYADALYLFSRFINEHGLKMHRPLGIQSTADMLVPVMRKEIEKAFGCKVHNVYGCREHGEVACECEHGNMHISDDCVVMEIVRNGKNVPAGEEGDIIITDLNAMAMPLIRYRIEDVGSLKSGRCKCGRGFSMMNMIQGRRTDIYTLSDGTYVHGGYFTHLFFEAKGVDQFQFIQTKIDEADLLMVVKKSFSKKDEEKIVGLLQEKTKGLMKINVKHVDKIDLAASGKMLYTKSEVAIDW